MTICIGPIPTSLLTSDHLTILILVLLISLYMGPIPISPIYDHLTILIQVLLISLYMGPTPILPISDHLTILTQVLLIKLHIRPIPTSPISDPITILTFDNTDLSTFDYTMQYRHLIPAPVDRTSASAWF